MIWGILRYAQILLVIRGLFFFIQHNEPFGAESNPIPPCLRVISRPINQSLNYLILLFIIFSPQATTSKHTIFCGGVINNNIKDIRCCQQKPVKEHLLNTIIISYYLLFSERIKKWVLTVIACRIWLARSIIEISLTWRSQWMIFVIQVF